jgi:hypothetical protein
MNHLYWSAVAALIALSYSQIMVVACDLFTSPTRQGTCPNMEMPAPLLWTLAAMFVYGLVAFTHRAYRDFYKGDFLWERPGY